MNIHHPSLIESKRAYRRLLARQDSLYTSPAILFHPNGTKQFLRVTLDDIDRIAAMLFGPVMRLIVKVNFLPGWIVKEVYTAQGREPLGFDPLDWI